jgi:hypothetical protein
MSSDIVQIHELAKRGAEARIEELKGEIEAIRKMFPGIEGAAHKSPGRSKATPAGSPALAKLMDPKRKRSGWSAAARRAVGLRMKKYWAARKKAEAEKKQAA